MMREAKRPAGWGDQVFVKDGSFAMAGSVPAISRTWSIAANVQTLYPQAPK